MKSISIKNSNLNIRFVTCVNHKIDFLHVRHSHCDCKMLSKPGIIMSYQDETFTQMPQQHFLSQSTMQPSQSFVRERKSLCTACRKSSLMCCLFISLSTRVRKTFFTSEDWSWSRIRHCCQISQQHLTKRFEARFCQCCHWCEKFAYVKAECWYGWQFLCQWFARQ